MTVNPINCQHLTTIAINRDAIGVELPNFVDGRICLSCGLVTLDLFGERFEFRAYTVDELRSYIIDRLAELYFRQPRRSGVAISSTAAAVRRGDGRGGPEQR